MTRTIPYTYTSEEWQVAKKDWNNLVWMISTDWTLAANSDSKISTQKATKTYVDNSISWGTYWQRSWTTVSPKTAWDNVSIWTWFLVLDKASWKWIKVDTTTPTFGWRDLLWAVHSRSPSTEPTFSVYRWNIYSWKFPTSTWTKEVFIEYHVPHDYLPWSDIYIHVHWSQNIVDTWWPAWVPWVAKWYFDITYADWYWTAWWAADPFVAPKTISITQQGSTTQYGHMIAEVIISWATDTATTFDRTKFKVDWLFLVRCYRDSSDVADTLDQSPFIHFVDMHYQTNGVMWTKDKNTPFYT